MTAPDRQSPEGTPTQSARANARQLADDLWLIDTLFLGNPGIIASYLLTGPDGLALVDVGSAVSVETLLAGVRAAGFDPAEIRHLLLTHIHLDHAGATGELVRRLPNAHVYVHPLGLPHLARPEKLLASAAQIYGDKMRELWGDILPVPEERMTALEDNAEVRVGRRTLRALYTPGHAVHHIAYYDPAAATAFTGDVAGVRLQGFDYVRPPTPPPDLNLEDWSASIARLRALNLREVYVAHYGAVGPVAPALDQLEGRLRSWADLALAEIRAGKSDADLAAALAASEDPVIARQAGSGPESAAAVRRYEIATNYLMSGQGYRRYFRKHHPELLA